MDVELHKQGVSSAHHAALCDGDKPELEVQGQAEQQSDERMGLLDDTDKALSTTDVEAFSLPDVFQVGLIPTVLLHHLVLWGSEESRI